MKIIPMGDTLHVKLHRVEEKKIGEGKLLYAPDKHHEPCRIGTVIEIGPEVKYFEKGDTVAVSYFTGVVLDLIEFGLLDDTCRIFKENEILAKIEE